MIGLKTSETTFLDTLMEFLLHGLAEYSALNKNVLANGMVFKDLFSSMFSMPESDDDDEFDEY